jgi:VWFA-related protein
MSSLLRTISRVAIAAGMALTAAAQSRLPQPIPDFSHIPDTKSEANITYQKYDKAPLKFSSTTEYVLVPVVVTGKDGKPVRGLKKEDFRLLENGKEQSVASAEFFQATPQPVTAEQRAANEFTNFGADAPQPRRLVVLALDMVNTPFTDQTRARHQLLGFLADHLEADALYELVAIENNGVRVLHEFTRDSSTLVEALKALRGRIPTGASVDTGAIARGETTQAGATSTSTQTSRILNLNGAQTPNIVEIERMDLARFETEYSIHQQSNAANSTLTAFLQIAERVSGVPGRKSLIWITGGFPFSVDPNSGQVSEGVAAEAYQHVMQKLSNELISLYPVDARGLLTLTQDISTKESNMQNRQPALFMSDEASRQRSVLETMRAFADMTGGRAFINSNDTLGAIREAADDGSAYYLLSYAMDKTNRQQGWRKILVKTPGEYRVRARQGYYVTNATLDPNATAKYDIDLALTSPFVYTGVPVKLTVTPPAGDGSKKKLQFAMIVPPKSVTVDSDASNHMHLEIAYSLRSQQGKDAGHKGVSYNLNLNPEQLAAIKTSGVSYNDTVELGPGNYNLTLVVRDNISGRVGSVQAPVEVK